EEHPADVGAREPAEVSVAGRAFAQLGFDAELDGGFLEGAHGRAVEHEAERAFFSVDSDEDGGLPMLPRGLRGGDEEEAFVRAHAPQRTNRPRTRRRRNVRRPELESLRLDHAASTHRPYRRVEAGRLRARDRFAYAVAMTP